MIQLPRLAFLALLATAACGGTEADTTDETTAALAVKGEPCRVETEPDGDEFYCDDGRVCYVPPGTRHGTIQECHPEGWPPP